MLRAILNHNQAQILKDERAALERLQVSLAGWEASAEDQKILQNSLRQLDELFLLVVVGEFNSGKSAFINALVGERIFPEGVTPTTAQINVLRQGAANHRIVAEDGLVNQYHPAEFLREISIVDTPGTNAIIRQHEQLTQEFVPRSDLVIFMTSADRPLTESERSFMEHIREWGKKVIILLNKIDLLEEEDVPQVIDYIRQNVQTLLGFMPEIFPMSARLAMRARQNDNPAEKERLWSESRFGAVEDYILRTLDEKSRVRLKLGNPLGVGERLAGQYRSLAKERLKLLGEDLSAIATIEGQFDIYQSDMRQEFHYHIADIEKVILAMSHRGMLFFDDTLRLARVLDLVNSQRVQGDFMRKVVADSPQEVEREVHDLIDWLIERDVRQWQTTLTYLENHQAKVREEQARGVGIAGSTFEYNRRALLDSVGRAASDVMQAYDHDEEARKLAESVQSALAGIALAEAGAVGLGVLLVTILNTALLDFTGILAAGSLAVIGLMIMPVKRRRAKTQFYTKLDDLRQRLLKTISESFERELDCSLQRLRETTAPFSRFVRAEQKILSRIDQELGDISALLAQVRQQIEE